MLCFIGEYRCLYQVDFKISITVYYGCNSLCIVVVVIVMFVVCLHGCLLLFTLYELVFSFFFFKQKTAYGMRISDWSSDVCSSDLAASRRKPSAHAGRRRLDPPGGAIRRRSPACTGHSLRHNRPGMPVRRTDRHPPAWHVGCTCRIRYRWEPRTPARQHQTLPSTNRRRQ